MDVRHEHADPTSPTVVVQLLGERLGLSQALQPRRISPSWLRTAGARSGARRPAPASPALRQRLEDAQRLLELGRGVREGRARDRLGAGLAEIDHRLLPQLAPQGVVGEPLDVLGEPVRR